jgi:hypothetical protein
MPGKGGALQNDGNAPMSELLSKLSGSARVAKPTESSKYFKPNDFRWAETDTQSGDPTIYINDKKFWERGAFGYRDKMAKLETLHLLKDVDPEKYKGLYDSAMDNPDYREWMKESYQHSLNDPEYKETRSLDDWHKQSRFDQVLGGYLMAGDENIPTAKGWRRDFPGYSGPFRDKLEKLRKELGFK